MGKDRGQKGGILINLGSNCSIKPYTSAPIYSATKHAIVGLTRAYGVSAVERFSPGSINLNYFYNTYRIRTIYPRPGFERSASAPPPRIRTSSKMWKSNSFLLITKKLGSEIPSTSCPKSNFLLKFFFFFLIKKVLIFKKILFRSEHVAKCLIQCLPTAPSGSIWIVENSQPPRQIDYSKT